MECVSSVGQCPHGVKSGRRVRQGRKMSLVPPASKKAVLLKWRTVFLGASLMIHRQRIRLQCWRCRFDTWVGKIPWRRAWQSIPVFLPGELHGQRSLVGYSPWGRKELDTTEATEHIFLGWGQGTHDEATCLTLGEFSLKMVPSVTFGWCGHPSPTLRTIFTAIWTIFTATILRS